MHCISLYSVIVPNMLDFYAFVSSCIVHYFCWTKRVFCFQLFCFVSLSLCYEKNPPWPTSLWFSFFQHDKLSPKFCCSEKTPCTVLMQPKCRASRYYFISPPSFSHVSIYLWKGCGCRYRVPCRFRFVSLTYHDSLGTHSGQLLPLCFLGFGLNLGTYPKPKWLLEDRRWLVSK